MSFLYPGVIRFQFFFLRCNHSELFNIEKALIVIETM